MPSVITTLVLRRGGGAVVTLRSGIYFLDLETGALDLIDPLTDPPNYVYNDGKVDRSGRFVIGASTANFANPRPDGGLFRLDPDRSLTRLIPASISPTVHAGHQMAGHCIFPTAGSIQSMRMITI